MSAANSLGLRTGLFDRNLSILTIPAAFGLAFLPHTLKVIMLGDRFDNESPRGPIQFKATDSSTFKEKIGRLGAIHTNGMENLPLFCIAVLAGNFARIPSKTLTNFSVGYIVSRLAYNFVYYYQSSTSASVVRSATYFAGLGANLWLIVKSGRRVLELI